LAGGAEWFAEFMSKGALRFPASGRAQEAVCCDTCGATDLAVCVTHGAMDMCMACVDANARGVRRCSVGAVANTDTPMVEAPAPEVKDATRRALVDGIICAAAAQAPAGAGAPDAGVLETLGYLGGSHRTREGGNIEITPMDDPILGLIIPPACFTCGMPVSNKVASFTMMTHSGVPAEEAFRRLGVRYDCCRRMLSSAPLEPRYKPKPPPEGHFVAVQHLSKLEAAPFTLRADGKTDPAPHGL
jgi:DNA-directed RNA polymerase subunit N (RpoN/RPB10)